MKVSRTVWTGGKGSDNFKALPISITKLNEISNNECYNFEAMCNRVGLDYSKVSAFLEISNSIMDKTIDFGPLLAQYQLQEEELNNLANNVPAILAL